MKILAFAYACEPGKGSEPGGGWAWARLLAHLGETWVITRENNRDAIESALSSTPEADSLHFVYVDLSERARSWKRGQRGIRLYYMLWQRAALRCARELQNEEGFDVVWHLTMANIWLGSLAALVGPPFIYGPVGGGIRPPWRLASALGARGIVYELIRSAGQIAGRYLNPAARMAWRRARLILVQNQESKRWLPKRYRGKAVVFSNAMAATTAIEASTRSAHKPRTALFAGRLLPFKGVAFAIRGIAATEGWQLVVAGAGYDERRLHRLARRLEVDQRVRFVGWTPREQVLDMMREDADVFLFPSMHEEAGLVLAEALACGLPVICLDRGGPPLLTGRAGLIVTSSGGVGHVVAEIAALLAAGSFPTESAIREQARTLTFEARLASLREILQPVLIGRSAG